MNRADLSTSQRASAVSGVTLIEVCIAMLIVSAAALTVAKLLVVSLAVTVQARLQTSTVVLAAQKMEQLRALSFYFEQGTLTSRTDISTDLTAGTFSSGGPGLSATPSNSLSVNTSSAVDYADAHGRWVGTGPTPPAAAAFIRRWNIAPLPNTNGDTLVMRVLVTSAVREAQATQGLSRRRLAGDAMLVTLLTRKAW